MLRVSCLVPVMALSASCGNPAGSPQFQYVASHACAEVVAYAWTEARTEYLVVDADLRRLGIAPGSTRTFEMVSARDVSINVDMYPQRALDLYCSDVRMDEKPIAWRAISGTVTIARPADPKREQPANPASYPVIITITHLVLEGPQHQKATARGPITLTGQAGGNPFG